jgi:hypothetical protein
MIRLALAACLLATSLACAPVRPTGADPSGSGALKAEDLMTSVARLTAPEMQGRRTGTEGNARARAWIVEQLTDARLTPYRETFELPFQFKPRRAEDAPPGDGLARGVNVAAVCSGTAAEPRRAIVISAHYDHLGLRNGAVHPGADDNASGVAVLLALARECHATPWRHDMIFVAFDAEEMGGLQGSRAFVATLSKPERSRIALNMNLDMVSRGDRGEIYIAGTHQTPALRPVVEPVVVRATIKVRFGHDSGGGRDDWTTQSDHRAFQEANIPFLYFGVEDHPDYHRPSDVIENITSDVFLRSALVILDAVRTVDRALPPSR